MSAYELYHELSDMPNVRVRREIVRRGLKDQIAFRNIYWEEDRLAFAALGGRTTPTLWDGTRLHEGPEAVLRALRAMMPPR